MRKTTALTVGVSALGIALGGLVFTSAVNAVGEMPSKEICAQKNNPAVVAGGCVATDRRKGNCMACHKFGGLENTSLEPGNIAPPLIAMKARYPDKKRLRALVWDASQLSSRSNMPPFGRHRILSETEIDLIVEWLYSL